MNQTALSLGFILFSAGLILMIYLLRKKALDSKINVDDVEAEAIEQDIPHPFEERLAQQVEAKIIGIERRLHKIEAATTILTQDASSFVDETNRWFHHNGYHYELK